MVMKMLFTLPAVMQIKKQPGTHLTSYKLINASKSTAAECGALCADTNACDSFNYNPSLGTCELNGHPNGVNATGIVADELWDWWVPKAAGQSQLSNVAYGIH